ncbi:MAG: hypothetical protein IH933_15780 [Euryarchaeota archaeon]|nr:hypothetical protein [Euryarchaeota archaeon]
MIDSEYPSSPLDPPFCHHDRSQSSAFRTKNSLVIYGFESASAWIRSTNAVETRP